MFEILCAPAGLDAWWTRHAGGSPGLGHHYRLFFGAQYDWAAVMRRYEPASAEEWEMTASALASLGMTGFQSPNPPIPYTARAKCPRVYSRPVIARIGRGSGCPPPARALSISQ